MISNLFYKNLHTCKFFVAIKVAVKAVKNILNLKPS